MSFGGIALKLSSRTKQDDGVVVDDDLTSFSALVDVFEMNSHRITWKIKSDQHVVNYDDVVDVTSST